MMEEGEIIETKKEIKLGDTIIPKGTKGKITRVDNYGYPTIKFNGIKPRIPVNNRSIIKRETKRKK